MSRNNEVFNILVTKDDQPLLGTDLRPSDLLPGQPGIFAFDTGLSIDGSIPVRNWYIAVGLDEDGDGITDNIATSAGSHIQSRNVRYYTFRPHTAGQPQIVVLRDYLAECETEYGIKIEPRNKEIYRTQGYNQFTQTFTTVTGCCTGCDPVCPSGDANEITLDLKTQINNWPAGLLTAEAIARQDVTTATHGTSIDYFTGDVMPDADVQALIAFNAGESDTSLHVYTDLQITTVTQAINAWCSVNLEYFYPRETTIIVSKVSSTGLKCTGVIETTQEAVFEEGAAYDIKQMEYEAKGWTEGPYRTSTLTGVADPRRFNTVDGEYYDIVALSHDQFSENAWLEYFNDQASYMAIPATDTNTISTVMQALDFLLTDAGLGTQGFDQLIDDSALADPTPTVIERTTDRDNYAEDGLS